MAKNVFLILFSILLSVVACSNVENLPESTPFVTVANIESDVSTTVTPTKPTTQTIQPTIANSPTPTSLPTNAPVSYVTMSPFPTVTPVGVYPVKQVFIQAGPIGGDGGSEQDFYFGRDTPSIVIYADGQIIMKVGSWEEDYAFLSSQLSTDELCLLLARLEATGYFNPVDTYYAFDETTQFTDGAGSHVIQVNGPINNTVKFYEPHRDYLIDEIAAADQLISSFKPSETLVTYVPENLLLWIEPTLNEDLTNLPDWPSEISPLVELRSDPSNSKVVVEREMILPLMDLFENRMSQQRFREGDMSYDVILRPLLPHETPHNFSIIPSNQSDVFELPFTCKNLTFPEVISTQTPTPLDGRLAPEAAKLRGRFVFASEQGGDFEIYVMYADGSQLTRLTNYPGNDTEPTWSPDGQKIAFVSDRSGRDEIYVMNADGTNVTRLTFSPSDKRSPDWSHDGSHIVYVDTHNADFPDFDNEIHMVGINGDTLIQLTDNGNQVDDINPKWLSPTQIIYASGDYPDFGLFIMADDGSDQIFLSNGNQPALSPDGKRLAKVITEFVNLGNSHYTEYNEIYVASISDLLAKEAFSIQITEENESNYSPNWSPDGQHIVFVSERDGNAELYVMKSDGSDPIRLTFTLGAEQSPDWMP